MKVTAKLSLLIVFALSARTVPAGAQTSNFQRAEAGRYDVSLSVGLDPAVVTEIGVLRWTAVGRRLVGLSIEAAVPVGGFDLHDYRVTTGASMSLVRLGTFRLATQLGVSARGTENMNFTAHGFGTEVSAFLGHYGRRTFAALELGYDKSLLAHIEHQPFYLDSYPDAMNGWYWGSAGMLRLGLTAGVTVRRIGIALRAFMARSEQGEDIMPPLGTTLSLSYGF